MWIWVCLAESSVAGSLLGSLSASLKIFVSLRHKDLWLVAVKLTLCNEVVNRTSNWIVCLIGSKVHVNWSCAS